MRRRNLEEVRQIVRAVNRPVNVVAGWLEPRHYIGAAQRGWRQANLWRAVSSYARNVRQRSEGHAAAWLIRMDARCCRTGRIIQDLICSLEDENGG